MNSNRCESMFSWKFFNWIDHCLDWNQINKPETPVCLSFSVCRSSATSYSVKYCSPTSSPPSSGSLCDLHHFILLLRKQKGRLLLMSLSSSRRLALVSGIFFSSILDGELEQYEKCGALCARCHFGAWRWCQSSRGQVVSHSEPSAPNTSALPELRPFITESHCLAEWPDKRQKTCPWGRSSSQGSKLFLALVRGIWTLLGTKSLRRPLLSPLHEGFTPTATGGLTCNVYSRSYGNKKWGAAKEGHLSQSPLRCSQAHLPCW